MISYKIYILEYQQNNFSFVLIKTTQFGFHIRSADVQIEEHWTIFPRNLHTTGLNINIVKYSDFNKNCNIFWMLFISWHGYHWFCFWVYLASWCLNCCFYCQFYGLHLKTVLAWTSSQVVWALISLYSDCGCCFLLWNWDLELLKVFFGLFLFLLPGW